jgi:hypothetical protein
MTAYTASAWTDLGATAAATAATLAGLLFVAVSINLRNILQYPNLPARAGMTLITFATPLVTGVLLVVPGQSRVALGCELLATGIAIEALQLRIHLGAERSPEETSLTWAVGRVLPGVASCGCLVIAGITLLAQAGGGLYWVVPSVLSAIVFGLVNVWVLLVEILR